METIAETTLPAQRPSLVDEIEEDPSIASNGDIDIDIDIDIDEAKSNTVANGIEKFLCNVERVVDPIVDVGDALQTNSFYDFFFGWLGGSSSNGDTCKCWDDEGTIFTAWTEYSACTGYSACTDYSAYTSYSTCTDYSACTDYASAVTFICVGEDEEWSDVHRCANNDDDAYDDDDLSAKISLPSKEMEGKGKASSNRFLNHIPFTSKEFKALCASNVRPLRFVAIRSGGDLVQDSIIPIAIDRPGSLGLAIKTDADGAVLVKHVPSSAMVACRKLRPGDILAHPSAGDFPTTEPPEGDSSSIKHPAIEIVFKDTNDAGIPPEKEKEDPSKADTSLSPLSSHRSKKSSLLPGKVGKNARPSCSNLDTSPVNDIEDAKTKDEEGDKNEFVENLKVSPPLVHSTSNSSGDECAESLCSIPRIEAIVKSSIKSSEPAPARNLQDTSKMIASPTNAKIHQPNSRPNGQSKANVIKSRVVPFDSKEPGMEEEYFKEIAAKSAEGRAESAALFGKLTRLEGPRLIRFPTCIFPSGALPSTITSGVDQRNDESKPIDADDTKPNEVETSAREPPDADQECDADKALAASTTNDTTTCTSPVNDGPFSGMRVLASQYLSTLQESKDKPTRMHIATIFNVLADEKGQVQTNESNEHLVREGNKLSPSNSASSFACEYTGEEDLQNLKNQAVKSIDSASTCIRYSVKVSKGIKKNRAHRRKKKKKS